MHLVLCGLKGPHCYLAFSATGQPFKHWLYYPSGLQLPPILSFLFPQVMVEMVWSILTWLSYLECSSTIYRIRTAPHCALVHFRVIVIELQWNWKSFLFLILAKCSWILWPFQMWFCSGTLTQSWKKCKLKGSSVFKKILWINYLRVTIEHFWWKTKMITLNGWTLHQYGFTVQRQASSLWKVQVKRWFQYRDTTWKCCCSSSSHSFCNDR